MKNFTLKSFLLLLVIGAITLVAPNRLSAQGSDALACNDLVHVIMDADCEALITPDMLLEGQAKPDDAYEINVYEGDQTDTPIAGSPVVTSLYVGATLTVTVTDLETGLMCWGEILLEDKSTPEISSEGISYPCYVDPTPVFPADYPAALASCCDLTAENFSYVDLPGSNGDCGGTFLRRWTVVGCNGINTNTTDQLVTITIPTITDVEFPADVTLECGDAYAPADLDGILNEGSFDEDFPTVNGLDIDETLCNLGATYVDQIIPICEGSFKVLRTWSVIDWCTSEVATEDQIIKVVDTIAPSISCPDNVTISTDINVCTGQLILPSPTVSDICSSATYSVAADGGVLTQGNNGVYLLSELALGTYNVTYTAIDACGNESDCSITIEVEDNVPPIAVCDEHTSVSIGGDGTALVNALTFDDGSHDNCGDVTFLVRRMDNPACPGFDGTPYGETVPFSCCDVNTTVMVQLQVTDAAGNTNTCMVEAFVEDKLGPHITCPPDVTISCLYEFDLEDLGASFGTVQTDADDIQDVITTDVEGPYGTENWGQDGLAVDNCDVTVTDTYTYNQECGNGLITRTFTATDLQGLTASCTQRISIINFDPFNGNDISWPSDKDADCSQGIDITTTGQPSVNDDLCDNVFVGHEDLVLEVSPPHCFKIIRTWVVIDWCQYDPNAPAQGGRWEHEQIIKVTDTDAPEFTSCQSPDTGCSYDEDCGPGYIELTAEATDNCTDVAYNYTIDAFNDGNVDITGNGNDASGDYPIGLHSITFYATDDCGNVAECTYTFEIIDCKQPTPVCKVLASSIMPSAGELTIWATDFEAGSSFDNCTAYEDLDIRIRKTTVDLPQSTSAPVESSVTFDCNEIGTQWVEIWVGDETGNWDYCTTYIVIQDPTGACGNPDPTALISGRIADESDEEVGTVSIDLAGTNGFEPFVTGIDGSYAFNNVDMHGNYTITPEKDNDHLNGISTFDAVLMSKHILGLETLSTPYKMIAADVNKSGTITTLDIVLLRKLILHIDTEFQNNTSWRFVDKSFVFADATNPFASTFPEVISINDLDENTSDADFMAVKIGDVNNSAIPNNAIGTQARNTVGNLVFNTTDAQLKAGDTYTVDFTAQEAVLGYQFTLNFDQKALELVETSSDENFGLSLLNEGVITSSFYNATATKAGFSITFKALNNVTLSNALTINSKYTTAEAYNADENVLDVALAFNGQVVTSSFELYQNAPNPFKAETTIGFNLTEAGNATLTVYDLSGKVLKQYSNDFAKGYNQFTINKSELAGSGVLYYQLDTNNDTDTKKMILID